MDNRCTFNDLVLYLYNETELTETVLVQNAIDFDVDVADTYNSMVAVKNLLDDSLVSASNKALQFVLDYARNKAPVTK
jgi:hypothetical protein